MLKTFDLHFTISRAPCNLCESWDVIFLQISSVLLRLFCCSILFHCVIAAVVTAKGNITARWNDRWHAAFYTVIIFSMHRSCSNGSKKPQLECVAYIMHISFLICSWCYPWWVTPWTCRVTWTVMGNPCTSLLLDSSYIQCSLYWFCLSHVVAKVGPNFRLGSDWHIC